MVINPIPLGFIYTLEGFAIEGGISHWRLEDCGHRKSSTPSPYSEMENEQRMVKHQMDQPKEMSRLFMSLIHVHRIFVSCE